MVSQLIVSLSGLSDGSPESLVAGAGFAAALDARGVALTHLYRPGAPPAPDAPGSPLVRWLHARGDAVVLHGYDHSLDPLMAGRLQRVGRRAEFAALPRHEAGLRLRAARRSLTAVGLRCDAFVPPRWLASAGTVEALTEQGFTVCADGTGVRLLQQPGAPVLRGRVLGFRRLGPDDRGAAEAWRCRVLQAETTRTARRGGLVRINVRAKDLRCPGRVAATLAAVDAALALGAVAGTYRLRGAARAA